MPPKVRIFKENIISAALDLVRECGTEMLGARNLAKRMGISTQPIFSSFENVSELRRAVASAAEKIYSDITREELESGRYPQYKASGMAYIRFAREEPELFKLLFMRDRSEEEIPAWDNRVDPIIDIIMRARGVDRELARKIHLEMWIFVHGIACMVAHRYLEWDHDAVSAMLTDVYFGIGNSAEGEKKK